MSNRDSIFGTDGVRGKAGTGVLTSLESLRLGAALVECLGGTSGRIALARDTRESGDLLLSSVAAGIQGAGGTALNFGVLPTPGLALLVESLPECVAGVMVTASHNPWWDNGLKFFGGDGHKLSEQDQARLEDTYRVARDTDEVPGAGRASGSLEDKSAWAEEAYLAALIGGARCRLDGRTIVVDHASGAAWNVLPRVLSELGANVVGVAPDPDGRNINQGTGAVHPEKAARKVVEVGAWAGVVVDGDGDRIYLVDEGGVIHDGDAIVGVLAGALSREQGLRGGAVIGTVTTGAGLEAFLAARGIDLIRTAVGDRHVAVAMDENGCNLGGESSGHVLTPDLCPSGDGSRVAIELLGRAITSESSLSELLRAVPRFPIARRRVDAGLRPPLEGLSGLQDVLREADEVLAAADGRQLLRYSGTEPVLRVQVEGKDADLVEAWADRIAAAANEAIIAVQ